MKKGHKDERDKQVKKGRFNMMLAGAGRVGVCFSVQFELHSRSMQESGRILIQNGSNATKVNEWTEIAKI